MGKTASFKPLRRDFPPVVVLVKKGDEFSLNLSYVLFMSEDRETELKYHACCS